MSRTDNTDPYWVKRNRYGKEEHDHREGSCNYDPHEGATHRFLYWGGNQCGKTYSFPKWYMYTAGPGEVKSYNKMFEHRERRRIKNVLRNGDWDNDVLDYKPRHSGQWKAW